MENYYTIGESECKLPHKAKMKYFASPRINKSRNNLQIHNMNAKFVTGDDIRREKTFLDTDYQFQNQRKRIINQGHVPKIKDLTFRKEAFTRQSQSEKRSNPKYGIQPTDNTYEMQNTRPRNSKRVIKYKKRRAFRARSPFIDSQILDAELREIKRDLLIDRETHERRNEVLNTLDLKLALKNDTDKNELAQQSPIQTFSNRKTKKFHGSPTRVKFDMNSSRKENLPK